MSGSPDPELVEVIAGRRAALQARLAELTDRPVRIVCVTKGHPASVAAAAVAAGFVDLGESYAQELVAKAPQVEGARWSFIGRLQTNKVRHLVGTVELWQSVDRDALVDQIARRAPGARVLVQLDLAGIEGRGGCRPADAARLVQRCRDAGLQVEGLMGVGHPDGPEASRPGFALLRSIADELGLVERSMGMSSDLAVAVEEGSTMVRVGTALVGPRST